jgi:hypothetical protein
MIFGLSGSMIVDLSKSTPGPADEPFGSVIREM